MKVSEWKSYILSLIIVALIIAGVYYQEIIFNSSQTIAVKGVLDLSNYDFNKNEAIKMNGDWELYWGALLTGMDFKQDYVKKPIKTGYINVPTNWRGEIQGAEIKSRGYATYRLKIVGLPKVEAFGIRKTNIRNSAIVFVNGIKILEDGVPAENGKDYNYGNVPKMAFFQTTSNDIEIIVQVANFDYMEGGIVAPIYFGMQKDIIALNNRSIIFESAVEAVLLIIGIIYLLLYFLIQKYRENAKIIISFGIFCILLAVANSLLSDRILMLLIPNLPFSISFKILQICILGAIADTSIFLNQMGEEIMTKIQRNIVLYFYAICFVLILTLPNNIYSNFLPIIALFGGIFLLSIFMKNLNMFISRRSMIIDRRSYKILLIALLSINIYYLDLTLMDLGFKTNLIIGNISILAYAIALIFLLVKRIEDVHSSNTEISLDLANTEKQALANENAFLRSQINPHFLYNALSTIISYCYTDGPRAANLLKSFSNYLRGNFDFDSYEKYVLLEKEIDLVNAYVDIQNARFGDDLKVEIEIEPRLLKCNIPPLSIQILMENAIRHGVMKREGGGTVNVNVYSKSDRLIVEVSDNGVGMPEDLIERLNDFKNNNESTSRQGVGLLNIQRRLINSYNSRLNIESTIGIGTKVSFELSGESMSFVDEIENEIIKGNNINA